MALVAAEKTVVGSGWYRIRLLLLVTVVVDADPDSLGFDMELGSRCITPSMHTSNILFGQANEKPRSVRGTYSKEVPLRLLLR